MVVVKGDQKLKTHHFWGSNSTKIGRATHIVDAPCLPCLPCLPLKKARSPPETTRGGCAFLRYTQNWSLAPNGDFPF